MILGLIGKAGAGKSSVANILAEEYGFRRLPFAGPLKSMALAVGLTDEEVHGSLKETPSNLLCGRTPRQFMQWIGTEFGREMIGDDFWVNSWRRQLGMFAVDNFHPLKIVADDVRFQNEVDMIKSLGGVIIRVHGREGEGSPSGASHPSETNRLQWDRGVVNDGPMEILMARVRGLMDDLSANQVAARD